MFTETTPFGIFGLPCEQPPPVISAYRVPFMNSRSATPSVWACPPTAEGSPLATVVRFQFLSNFEIRAVRPPLYGPTGPGTWVHPMPEFGPPGPASATYRSPSGPNLNPRGDSSPFATTTAFADSCAGSAWGAMLTAIPTTGSRMRLIDELSIKRVPR